MQQLREHGSGVDTVRVGARASRDVQVRQVQESHGSFRAGRGRVLTAAGCWPGVVDADPPSGSCARWMNMPVLVRTRRRADQRGGATALRWTNHRSRGRVVRCRSSAALRWTRGPADDGAGRTCRSVSWPRACGGVGLTCPSGSGSTVGVGGGVVRAGEAAAAVGVTVKALGYNEGLGLLRPLRGSNGYRVYRAEDVRAASVGDHDRTARPETSRIKRWPAM